MAGDIIRPRLTKKLGLCHLHDAALVGAFDRLKKVGTRPADIDLRQEPAALERQRHAVGTAPARPGAEEDGRGFAPELELERRRRLERPVRPAERHHDAGRPAGEFGRLVEIGRRRGEARQVRHEALLEPQRVAAVVVVGRVPAEFPVAALAVTRNRRVIRLMDFEPHRPAVAVQRGRLGRREQHRADTPPAHVRRGRDGIEPRHRRARTEQHDGGAGQAIAFVRHDHLRGLGLEKAPQAAARQPVGREHTVLKVDQRVDIARLGIASTDLRRRRMG